MDVRGNCFTVARSIAVFCLALPAARVIVAQAAAPESDHDLIQGQWQSKQKIVRGDEMIHVIGSTTRTFSKDTIKGESGLFPDSETGTYVIRPEKTPKEIDLITRRTAFMEFSGKEVTSLGIYRIEGDKLTICESVTKRPTEFRTAPDLDWVLTEYTRWVYDVDPDLDKLVGQWRVVRSSGRLAISRTVNRVRDRDGWVEFRLYRRDTPPGVDHGQAKVIKVNSLVASFRDDRGMEIKSPAPRSRKKPRNEGFSITIDSRGAPKRVTVGGQGPHGDGTYVLDGDTLTITLEGWKLVLQRKGG